MTKKDLINQVKKEYEGKASAKEVEELVNLTFKVLGDAIASNDKVCVQGIGSFNIRERKATETINAITGEPLTVQPTRWVSYKASSVITDKLNGKQ